MRSQASLQAAQSSGSMALSPPRSPCSSAAPTRRSSGSANRTRHSTASPGSGGQWQHSAEQLRNRPGRAGGADVEDAGAAQRLRGVLKRLDRPAAGQRRVVAGSPGRDGHRLQVGGHAGSVLARDAGGAALAR